MTQKQKAKRYDEALKVAKDIRNGKATYIPNGTPVIEAIFPELKKSEDEKIRGAIIHFISHTPTVPKGIIGKETMIAWLEKQGDSPIKWNKNTEGNKPQVNHSVLMKTTHGITEGERQGEQWYQYRWSGTVKDTDVLSWMELSDLEKQGEQKLVGLDDTNAKRMFIRALERVEEQNNKGYKLTDCDKNSWWEDFKTYCGYTEMQKPTDKVEPKFHEGEWVVSSRYTSKPFCITKICDTYYLVDNDSFIPFEQESDWRLWTIQDAKAGDVLACNEEILLFKSYSVQNCISLYCWYNGQTNNFHNKEVNDMSVTTRNKICPATKEQRDLLLQKMKESGYELATEKKELKKIEQKLTIKPKFKVGDTVKDPYGDLYRITEITNDSYKTDDGRFILFENQEVYTLSNFTAWNDEDEKIYQSIMDDTVQENQLDDKQIKWLRDIKYRYFPQPKQEWSEEDEAALGDALWCCKQAASIAKDENDMGNVWYAENWLKSLKPQNTWKPSDKQMEALWNVYQGGEEQAELATLYNDLTKLRKE